MQHRTHIEKFRFTTPVALPVGGKQAFAVDLNVNFKSVVGVAMILFTSTPNIRVSLTDNHGHTFFKNMQIGLLSTFGNSPLLKRFLTCTFPLLQTRHELLIENNSGAPIPAGFVFDIVLHLSNKPSQEHADIFYLSDSLTLPILATGQIEKRIELPLYYAHCTGIGIVPTSTHVDIALRDDDGFHLPMINTRFYSNQIADLDNRFFPLLIKGRGNVVQVTIQAAPTTVLPAAVDFCFRLTNETT